MDRGKVKNVSSYLSNVRNTIFDLKSPFLSVLELQGGGRGAFRHPDTESA